MENIIINYNKINMNVLNTYLFFNIKYKSLNRNQLLLQYKKDLCDDKIIKTYDDFTIKYPNFDPDFYNKANNLNLKSNKDIIQHWINYGVYNNYIESINKFYLIYKNININSYKYENKLNLINEEEIIIHYLNYGRYNKSSNKLNYNCDIIKNENINIDSLVLNNNNKLKKIGHLFIHFFKCGGGEIFINNFINLTKIQNIIFVKKNNNNNLLNNNIIYYTDEEDLKKKIKEHKIEILIDHQYYLYNTLKINDLSIIYFIHTIDHYKKKDLNIHYTINLYNERFYDKSWNNHIKIINYLGINHNINYKKIIYKLKYILKNKKYDIQKIGIVGRIDYHKININFLTILINFIRINNIEINIYGEVEKSYARLFFKKIKNIGNIHYKGYIEYYDINNIYLDNDIILSASKSEAGATVLLEAMNNGTLVICRNKGGNKETINNNKYLYSKDEDFINILENIKKDNIENILKDIIDSKKKILLKHNNKNNFKKLINHFNEIKNIEDSNKIPNVIHYIFGLKIQDEEFKFLYYFGILSNILINKPIKIFFHYKYLPYGYWWNKIEKYLTLNYIDYDDMKFNNENVIHYAHKSDYIRLVLLYKFGGIYYDIDTICVKSHDYLLENEIVLGIQEKYKNESDLFGNAVIMSKKNNFFIKKILDNFEKNFDNSEWTKASLFLPTNLYNDLDDKEKENIKILNNKYFYYPNYNENYLLFNEDIDIDKNLTTFHYCYNYSKLYVDKIENIDYMINNNNLFSKLMKNVYNIYNINFNNIDNNYIIKKSIIDLVIIINNYDENIINNINSINNLFFYNINLFIITKNKMSNNYIKLIKNISYFKNINIYYIRLYEEIDLKNKLVLSEYLIDDLLINNDIYYLILNKNLNNIFFEENAEKMINFDMINTIDTKYNYIITNKIKDESIKYLINIFYIKNIIKF